MLTVKLVYKSSNVPDDLKWATNTHMTPFTLTFKTLLTITDSLFSDADRRQVQIVLCKPKKKKLCY